MPYCRECGFQVEGEMQFCPNCGANLKPQRGFLEKSAVSAKSDKAHLSTSWHSFTNGAMIGLGGAIILGALAVAYFLNMSFWALRESLAAEGLAPQEIDYLVSDIRVLISGAASFALLGVYFVVFSAVSQFSSTGRAILNSRNKSVGLGNGCFFAALVFAGSSVQNLVSNIYSLYPSDIRLFVVFGVSSIVLVVIGVLLMMTAKTK